MKYLLIILSILLLSSPVIGDNHKGETLYLWFVGTEMVWKGFGDKDKHPVYQGEVENGVPNGLGILTYLKWRKLDENEPKYVGEWKDGKKNGQGTETYPNGKKYEGEWKDGERWNVNQYDKNGNIIWKYVNGKMINYKLFPKKQ